MTGVELTKYLSSCKLFRSLPHFSLETDDGGLSYEMFPTNWTAHSSGVLKIEVIRYFWGKKELWVEFTFGSLFASHKLEDLTFETLRFELDKILNGHSEFQRWSKEWSRDYKIGILYTDQATGHT